MPLTATVAHARDARGRRAGVGHATHAGPTRRRRPRVRFTPYLFIAPGFALFALLIAYPMVRAFQMSFYDWQIVQGAASKFTGLDNYVKAYHDPIFFSRSSTAAPTWR